MGKDAVPFVSISSTKFRDNSLNREPRFKTRIVKDYQEKQHFAFGNVPEAMMTTTWTHFSKRHVLGAHKKAQSIDRWGTRRRE